jgi:hypothetical protein
MVALINYKICFANLLAAKATTSERKEVLPGAAQYS